MNNSKQSLDELFASITKANQTWYENLLSLTTEQSDNSVMNMYQQFFDNATSYLEKNNNFYTDQLKMWQQFFANKNNIENIIYYFLEKK
jgi:hypothetical protein